MTASRLSIQEHHDDHLEASGVIDAHTAPVLEAALAAIDTDVTLDLSTIDFIDSSGLRVIVAAHQRLDDHGHRLTLRGPSESVERLFEITGLKDHLHISA